MQNEELTRIILEACFEVSNELGSGFLESVYENALLIAISQKGLKVEAQHPLSVTFRDAIVGQFFADLWIEDSVIAEIKAVSALLPQHSAQVINYLKATDVEIGLLVNFGNPRLEYKRLHKNLPSLRRHTWSSGKLIKDIDETNL
ncbi:MAG: GxxExxY protein [Anaerolineales bacterium]